MARTTECTENKMMRFARSAILVFSVNSVVLALLTPC
jgi:hypothetical protein